MYENVIFEDEDGKDDVIELIVGDGEMFFENVSIVDFVFVVAVVVVNVIESEVVESLKVVCGIADKGVGFGGSH